MDSREALIALNLIEGVGPVRARSLLEHFGDAPKNLTATAGELRRVRGIGEDTAAAIHNWETTIDLKSELKRIADFGVHVLIASDALYPDSLREIYDPPRVKPVTICKPDDRSHQFPNGSGIKHVPLKSTKRNRSSLP